MDLAKPLNQAPHHGEGNPGLVQQKVLQLLGTDPQSIEAVGGLHRSRAPPSGEDAHLPEELALLHDVEPGTHVDPCGAPKHDEEGGTYVIPGHGRICDEFDVLEYRDMVTIIRDRVQDMIGRGITLQQVKSAGPTMDYDGLYGATSGSWTTDRFVEAVYRSLSRKQ